MSMYHIVVFLPIVAAAIAGFGGRWIGDRGAQWVTCGAVGIGAVLSLVAFATVAVGGNTATVEVFTWIDSGAFEVSWSIRVDQLTAVMLVVVNVVSALVHVYSVGYMAHDPHIPRFMAYLSLFTFAMLMLVTADNFVQLYFGWEGVGLASYLLIGFWHERPSANAAAIKAFLVNRVGDFGFALGIMAIFLVFGSVEFSTVFAAAPSMQGKTLHFLSADFDLLTTICLLLFVGAMGKSAQVPLHTWLPDAMEGPTPVSALIHAATMVTAGVFMVARCSPLFELSETALIVVTVVGAGTAFFAATVGLVQNDIKRVVAYSTCSQLGYMFFACGVGAYGIAIFHLFTHAFFKALLFLGSGSVIHGLDGEQDMRKMGGMRKLQPWTFWTMWLGTLSLAGFPLFAGFYSKDMILESAFASATGYGEFAFYLGIAAATMTAFYSTRLMFMTFHGEHRGPNEVFHHAHESPPVILVPLVLLALGAVFAGVGFNHYFAGEGRVAFWGGSIAGVGAEDIVDAAHHVPLWVKAMATVALIVGIAVSATMYLWKTELPGRIVAVHREAYLFLLNKWYFDELYELVLVRPAKWLGRFLWQQGDGRVIDGFGPDGMATTVLNLARRATLLQTGYLYHYAFAMLIGIVAMITWYFLRLGG
jgi:NADH-quinone oxidoreductase subunit L